MTIINPKISADLMDIAHNEDDTAEAGDGNAQKIAEQRPLCREDFECLSSGGFGDGWNHYAHCMIWFKDHLYVGSSRAIMAMIKVNDPPPNLTFWPINSPDDVYDIDRRAHIWRFDPRAQYWQQVYQSPMVEGRSGQIVARDIGYRGAAVYQGPQDEEPCLYICTWSPSRGQPPMIMRSVDGLTFEPIPRPSWGDNVNTFRTLVPFKGCLFTTPTGSTAGYGKAQECVGGAPVIYVCHDPQSGIWREASVPGFGDPNNVTTFEMTVYNGFLYAGTINAENGYQIWKTRAEGEPPYEWTLVVTHGAYRGNLNEIAVSMCELGGLLYIGSGIVNGGYHRLAKVGPAAGEIIRLHPDDSWDLVIGNPRVTPDGLKFPLGHMGPGFDNFFNGYIWRMFVHEGYMYVGTFKWSTLMPYIPLELWPMPAQFLVEVRGLDEIEQSAGVDLWCTNNGEIWHPVTRNGFDNKYNWGIRGMAPTPYGLFIGTANPFGPEVALKTPDGWEYQFNPAGGLEVWWGKPRK